MSPQAEEVKMVSAPSASHTTSMLSKPHDVNNRCSHCTCAGHAEPEFTANSFAPYFSTHSKVGVGGVEVGVLVAVLVGVDVMVVVWELEGEVVADVVAVVVVGEVLGVEVRLVVADVDGEVEAVVVTVEVRLVVGEVEGELVADVVAVVVGVVTAHDRKPPRCHVSAIAFNVAVVASQSDPSNKNVPNAHPTFSASPSGGPLNSRSRTFKSAAVAAQSLLSTSTDSPVVLERVVVISTNVPRLP